MPIDDSDVRLHHGSAVNRVRSPQSRGLRPLRSGMLFPLIAALCSSLAGTALGAPCEVPDAGGTAELPPIGCDYRATGVPMVITNGLPPGTTIELEPVYEDFICNGGGASARCQSQTESAKCPVGAWAATSTARTAHSS